MMMMIMLRLLSLLGLKSRWHRHFSPRARTRCFFRGEGCRWIRGLRAQNACAIGIQPVHTRVDSGGLPPGGEPTNSDFALGAGDFLEQAEEGPLALGRDRPVDRQRLEAVLEALAAHAVVEVA